MHYSIFDSTVENYMVTCSRYIVARIFESVVVVAEVYEYPDLLLSMGILVTQRLSDRTRSTYWTNSTARLPRTSRHVVPEKSIKFRATQGVVRKSSC